MDHGEDRMVDRKIVMKGHMLSPSFIFVKQHLPIDILLAESSIDQRHFLVPGVGLDRVDICYVQSGSTSDVEKDCRFEGIMEVEIEVV
jgi:hypothetical protein